MISVEDVRVSFVYPSSIADLFQRLKIEMLYQKILYQLNKYYIAHGNQEIQMIIQTNQNKTMTLHLEYAAFVVVCTKGSNFSNSKSLTNQTITLQSPSLFISFS
jgi:hypothetical protein